jgi:hypothetical protein
METLPNTEQESMSDGPESKPPYAERKYIHTRSVVWQAKFKTSAGPPDRA